MPKRADGSAAGVDVELSSRLTEQLSLLALGAVRDGEGLVEDLSGLVSTLLEVVTGYAGLRLTLVHDGQPVRVTALLPPRADHAIITSLRLALPPVSSTFDEGGRLVVWSTVPGSLVDLAADLGYVFDDTRRPGRSASRAVTLDDDLPQPGATSGVEGLEELATIHRAAGLLIARGQDPASVLEKLRYDAGENGASIYRWAIRLLVQP